MDFPTLGFPTMFTKPALCIEEKRVEVEEVVAMNAMNALKVMNALKATNALNALNKSRLSEKREGKEEATFGSVSARPKVAY